VSDFGKEGMTAIQEFLSSDTPLHGAAQASSPRPVAVEVQNLVKEFPARRGWLGGRSKPVEAVRGISFTLHAGEIFGLVGPNGAGKTTLIKMLTTLLEPSSGIARIGGLDVVAEAHRVRQLVGLVASNERSFYWRLTGYQNLLFFADIYRIPRLQALPWIDELVRLLDLQDRIHHRFDGYSTGMRQRLALARGLLNRPGILFMDEPTKGVDPIGSAEIIRIIKQRIVPQWRPMILITSHNLSEIEKLCDRIAFMRKGRIVACGTLRELRSAAAPLEQYEMVVGGLLEPRVAALAVDAGASDVLVKHDPRGVHLSASFEQDGDGFPRLIAAVVHAGGAVEHCTSRIATIDEVFDRLITTDHAQSSSNREEAI
jgi:ABC-2 type transport system ATP-binding protein